MNPFALAYREQRQLFMFDKAYIAGTLFKIGGLATLAARFIVQFFWNPTVAVILTCALLALSTFLLWTEVRTSKRDWRIIPLCLIPACLIGASLSDNSLHFDFLTSILLAQTGLLIHRRIKKNSSLWSILITVILYLTAGPSALLFAFCSAINLLTSKTTSRALSITPVLTALACGVLAYLLAAVPTWGAAFSPAFYYDLDNSMPVIHWAPWVAIALVHTIATFVPKAAKTTLIAGSIAFVAALVLGNIAAKKIESKASLASYEYEYYTVNERWDDLITSCKHNEWTPLTANYLNLALAQKGTLLDELLKYDQRGVMSLTYSPEDKTVDARMAHIMFAMGNMAAAQDVAFNGLNTLTGYCPAMLKINAEVELMRGSYDVADKYLSMLEKAPRYKKWAKERQRFLWNDDAVESDPVLGTGRRDFPLEEGFAMFGNPVEELSRIIEANPSDSKAMSYGMAFLLLAKDISGLYKFVDKYWGSPAMRKLPVIAQEALVFYSEYSRNMENIAPVDPEWCLHHGVTTSVMDRFRDFQQASLKSGGKSPSGYRGTYWNYLLYTAI